MGDFGSASEAIRIIDLFALQIFAKNLGRCNFRLLQHYRPFSEVTRPTGDVRLRRRNGKALLEASRNRSRVGNDESVAIAVKAQATRDRV